MMGGPFCRRLSLLTHEREAQMLKSTLITNAQKYSNQGRYISNLGHWLLRISSRVARWISFLSFLSNQGRYISNVPGHWLLRSSSRVSCWISFLFFWHSGMLNLFSFFFLAEWHAESPMPSSRSAFAATVIFLKRPLYECFLYISISQKASI